MHRPKRGDRYHDATSPADHHCDQDASENASRPIGPVTGIKWPQPACEPRAQFPAQQDCKRTTRRDLVHLFPFARARPPCHATFTPTLEQIRNGTKFDRVPKSKPCSPTDSAPVHMTAQFIASQSPPVVALPPQQVPRVLSLGSSPPLESGAGPPWRRVWVHPE